MNLESDLPDRRAAEARRAAQRTSADESWFGAFGSDGDTQIESSPDTGFENSRILAREALRSAAGAQPAFARIYRNFVAARAALGAALAVALAVAVVFGLRPSPWSVAIGVGYAVLACGLWLAPRLRPDAVSGPRAQLRGLYWMATIGVDLVCFLALHVLAIGSGWNYVALLVLPLLMAGVLTPRKLALATAAVVSLALLVVAWLAVAGGGDATLLMTQAGLAGIGFFAVTALAGELAGRLAREELSARGSMEMARQQAQLNQLVIEEMQDGVLVVDRRGRVRAANPAARRLLADTGIGPPAPFQLRGVGAWESLVGTVERAFVEAVWPEAGRDVTLRFASGATRTLRVRVRFTRKRVPKESEEFCVLFLEDVRNMVARTRQEKLAAMGRVSAGIAHEIRNPLAAIAQANALLHEDATDPAQRQLSRMVADNVDRLKRIVDDVMAVSPGAASDSDVIDGTAQVATICAEWARGAGVALAADSALRVELPADPIGVTFDAEHLRRVLVNLLDNAHRHASRAPGAIHVRLEARDELRAFLSVASDGAPIAPEVERHLFEPFFSTRSRGTGLGLYICRELCERHGASIDFRLRAPDEPQRNEFYVVLRRRALLGAAQARMESTP
jgi:two-component system sensor histidine kinase PilS (NtrC family)